MEKAFKDIITLKALKDIITHREEKEKQTKNHTGVSICQVAFHLYHQ